MVPPSLVCNSHRIRVEDFTDALAYTGACPPACDFSMFSRNDIHGSQDLCSSAPHSPVEQQKADGGQRRLSGWSKRDDRDFGPKKSQGFVSRDIISSLIKNHSQSKVRLPTKMIYFALLSITKYKSRGKFETYLMYVVINTVAGVSIVSRHVALNTQLQCVVPRVLILQLQNGVHLAKTCSRQGGGYNSSAAP